MTLDVGDARDVRVAGVMDAHTAPELAAALEQLGVGGPVTLDLAAVEFIDSSGLRTIVEGHQALAAAGQPLKVTAISEAVERLFEITGLDEHLSTS